ncbi:MAG: DUF5812 family protein [Haloplanus sp.]
MTDEASAETNEKEGTFLVTAADAESAVLTDVDDGQVHALSTNPGVERWEAVVGRVAPDPPLDLSWQLVSVEERWSVGVGESDESPTALARDLAADQSVGELTRRERAGTGEVHVLTVPEDADATADAVADVLDDDEGLRTRAARLGVARVELRSEPGVVSVRYLP